MELTPRLFLCSLCYKQVIICTHCDRGNIYCDVSCSFAARKRSLREAGGRYQNSTKGRVSHALRQRRYMQRLRDFKNKMTHQGSRESISNGLLCEVKNKATKIETKQINAPTTCHLCHESVSSLLRSRFLRYSTPKKMPLASACSRPP